MNKICLVKLFKTFIVTSLAICSIGFVVMILWNYTLATLFTIPRITFLQAAGLLLLTKILVIPFAKYSTCPHCRQKFSLNGTEQNMPGNLSPFEKERLKKKLSMICKSKEKPAANNLS